MPKLDKWFTDIKWTAQEIDVADLKPYDRNPRTITKEAFARLVTRIKEEGFRAPITTDGKGTILAGHQRYRAAKELGYSKLPIMVPDRQLTPEECGQIVVADNVSHGEWDFDILSADFEPIELAEWGVELPDLTQVDPEDIEEDEAPEPPAIPNTVLGDVWILGNHRVMCGDSTSIDAVDKLMNGAKADMLITDPPYNVAYEGKTKEALTIQNDAMNDGDFMQFLTDAFSAADSALKPGGVFYIWHSDSEGYNFRGSCKAVGWKVRQCLIWLKNSMVMGRQDYHWRHEPCLYGWKDGAAHLWNNDRKQTTILEFDRPQRNGEHPTMKPLSLIAYQIGNNSKSNDVVLDLFGGSGSTLIAAEQLDRKCYMMELDPQYVDVIVTRWQNLTGRQAIHAETGEEFNAKNNMVK
jgi:site-specific DNA-methyltransferase (adenine-specific)